MKDRPIDRYKQIEGVNGGRKIDRHNRVLEAT